MRLYACWLGGCLFFWPLEGDVLSTTHVTESQYQRLKSRLARSRRFGCCAKFGLFIAKLVHSCSRGLFRHLHRRGNSTIIFVANEAQDFNDLQQQFGPYLDGIMTDKPSNLAEYVSEFESFHKKALL